METEPINKEQAFLLFAAHCGDYEKVAHALNTTAAAVMDMAEVFKWNERLRPILALKKSAAPGDIERALNRAFNFVQAHRLRLVLDRAISKLSDAEDEEFSEWFFEECSGRINKDGSLPERLNKFSSRALCDLASACEKVSAMSYAALCDHASDRARRDEETEGSESSGQIHAAIARAMSAIGTDASPAVLLLKAQEGQAKQIIELKETRYDKG